MNNRYRLDVGHKIGKLTAIKLTKPGNDLEREYLYQCDCGGNKVLKINTLMARRSQGGNLCCDACKPPRKNAKGGQKLLDRNMQSLAEFVSEKPKDWLKLPIVGVQNA